MEPIAFDHFSRARDFDLYSAGYLEAFQESFPGVPISSAILDDTRSAVGALESTEHTAAITALIEGKPVGFSVVSLSTFFGVLMGYIESFYVSPNHRGRGIGKSLLEKTNAWCRTRHARILRLDVSASNDAALELYQSNGFVVTRYRMEQAVF